MTSDATPQMPSISFSAHGILENQVLGKAPGPDVLTTYIFKHCTYEIAPILQMLLHSLLILAHFHNIGLLSILHQFIRKAVEAYHASNYRPISLTSVCSKVMDHIVFHSIMQHVQHYGILHICQCKEDDQY